MLVTLAARPAAVFIGRVAATFAITFAAEVTKQTAVAVWKARKLEPVEPEVITQAVVVPRKVRALKPAVVVA